MFFGAYKPSQLPLASHVLSWDDDGNHGKLSFVNCCDWKWSGLEVKFVT